MEQLFGAQAAADLKAQISTHGIEVMLPRMLAAVLISALLAIRPWRLLMGRELPKKEMVQAQILLGAAASVITVVIGDSVAKAFGLVGLGSFVRFRSGIKDARDAAVLFLMIGLGMACGHGSIGLAIVGGAFIAVILMGIDLLRGEKLRKHRMTLSAQSDDPVRAEEELRKLFGEKNVVVKSSALDLMGKKLELELEERQPGAIASVLAATEHTGVRGVTWTGASSEATKEELR